MHLKIELRTRGSKGDKRSPALWLTVVGSALALLLQVAKLF